MAKKKDAGEQALDIRDFGEVFLDTGMVYSRAAVDYAGISTKKIQKQDNICFGFYGPFIRKVVFNGPTTIVFWSDNTKTVVKCGPDDIFDKEKGLAMAICKKMACNDTRFHKVFKQWCKPDETNEDEVAYSKAMKELNQMAAQTRDGIERFLTKAYMAMHSGYSAADKNEKK